MNDERRSDELEERRTWTATAWLMGFMAGLVILVLLLISYEIGFNNGKNEAPAPAAEKPASKQPGGTEAAASSAKGQDLFVQSCGTCHTLSAAGTSGTTGPNLDDLQPDEAQVQAAIENGGTGSGVMPKGLYSGAEAQQVASYVAGAAGS